jgi:hypothetical protein
LIVIPVLFYFHNGVSRLLQLTPRPLRLCFHRLEKQTYHQIFLTATLKQSSPRQSLSRQSLSANNSSSQITCGVVGLEQMQKSNGFELVEISLLWLSLLHRASVSELGKLPIRPNLPSGQTDGFTLGSMRNNFILFCMFGENSNPLGVRSPPPF